MIEAKFEYTSQFLNKLNKGAVKKNNLINEIAMFIVLAAAVVGFIIGNTFMGISLIVVFGALLTSFVLSNIAISKSNMQLLGQKVNIEFGASNMKMVGTIGDKVLYDTTFEYKAIKKVEVRQDIVYIFFDSKSVITVPQTAFKTNEDYRKATELISNNYVV